MTHLRKCCVFCGSRMGTLPAYQTAAQQLGKTLAQAGICVVYGGGNVGLMGTIADAALHAGGDVIGVIPEALYDRELAHTQLTELIIVNDMHTRKMRMAQLADAFIAMPGGWGTLEELAEVLTWKQLGFHHKPCGLLNVEGFYDSLLQMFSHMTQSGFLLGDHLKTLHISAQPNELIELLLQETLPNT